MTNKDMRTLYSDLQIYTLNSLEKLIMQHNLTVKKEVMTYGFSIELENADNFISLYYGTHPYDYPFNFDVRYCKQALFDKSNILYKTDTIWIYTLWRFDKCLDTQICVSYEKDIFTIEKCCVKSIEMFEYFEKLSNEEYLLILQNELKK